MPKTKSYGQSYSLPKVKVLLYSDVSPYADPAKHITVISSTGILCDFSAPPPGHCKISSNILHHYNWIPGYLWDIKEPMTSLHRDFGALETTIG